MKYYYYRPSPRFPNEEINMKYYLNKDTGMVYACEEGVGQDAPIFKTVSFRGLGLNNEGKLSPNDIRVLFTDLPRSMMMINEQQYDNAIVTQIIITHAIDRHEKTQHGHILLNEIKAMIKQLI